MSKPAEVLRIKTAITSKTKELNNFISLYLACHAGIRDEYQKLIDLSKDLTGSDQFKASYDAMSAEADYVATVAFSLKISHNEVKKTLAVLREDILNLGKKYKTIDKESGLPIIKTTVMVDEWKALPTGVLTKYGATPEDMEAIEEYETLGEIHRKAGLPGRILMALETVIAEVTSKIEAAMKAEDSMKADHYRIDGAYSRLSIGSLEGVTPDDVDRLEVEKIKTLKQLAEFMEEAIPNSEKKLRSIVKSGKSVSALLSALEAAKS